MNFPFFLVLVLGSILLGSQEVSVAQKPIRESSQVINNQYFADSVSSEVRAAPEKIQEIVRRSILTVYQPGDKISPQSEAEITAIIAAASAATTRDNMGIIVSAGVGVDPDLAPIISKASLSNYPKGIESKLVGERGESQVLGNVRVIQCGGRNVRKVDRDGKDAPLKVGDFLREGAKIFTGAEGNALLLFDNGSTVEVGPESEFSIDRFLEDPFETKVVDYKRLAVEPSKSSTRLRLETGTILTNVKKLKPGSTFNVSTSVGSMGIKGTGFFIRSLPGDNGASVSFGVSNGQVKFTTASGNSRFIDAGQSFEVGGAADGFNFNAAPAGAAGLLKATESSAVTSVQSTPNRPFDAAPPSAPAPFDVLANLTPGQRQALEQAAEKGSSAVVEISAQLALADPASAPAIAAAAAQLFPSSAIQIASGIAVVLPSQASSVAASVAAIVPAQAPAVTAAVASAVPSQAAQAATAVAAVVPLQAPGVTAAVAAAVPAQAAFVASAVATALPSQAVGIASATASAAPAQADAISSAVSTAVPGQANAVSSAVNAAAQGDAANAAGVISNTAITQNPGALTTPAPSPTPTPTPPPTPTPTPTPVSPSA